MMAGAERRTPGATTGGDEKGVAERAPRHTAVSGRFPGQRRIRGHDFNPAPTPACTNAGLTGINIL